MRYYNIVITDKNGKPLTPSSLGGLPISSLLPNGQVNTAALNIELDIPVAAMHAPTGQAFVRIWGLSLDDIGSSFNLTGAQVSIYGGMSAGLPLANPSQAGLLVKGQVLQSYGNWLGLEQTVDLILSPAAGTPDAPLNYILNWKQGQTLATALQTTLSTALPSADIKINLNPRLTLSYDQVGFYGTITSLAALLYPLSKSIITDARYQGVTIAYDGVTCTVTDGTTTPSSVTISFQDLIGQPTRIQPGVVQAKVVMRGDISISTMINLPPGLTSTTSSALSSLANNQSTSSRLQYSGPYQVSDVHHYGNFRQPDAASWNTTINMIQPPAQ